MTGQDGTSASPGEPGVTGDLFSPACPTRQLLDRIGDKWTSMLVKVLAEAHPEELGFAQLRRCAPGVSHKMLSQTLQSLRRDGLVTRRVEPAVPPRVYYALTDLGLSLDAPLAVVRTWAERHIATIERARIAFGKEHDRG
ncbi:winged helix-turn-helix transcriptional regulator [Dactylosporangium matsuzakiense]|uniref:HxlR family transcriptional regulator n=1 Tax=Dactylosporangium matsuzakiense TaxID=53360 RepID=A0A9W6NMA0_9ACTN|nr:helix-turn-helix domain-containing protein [Dactylosporangium matsuzakiense]GLL02174.1 HxlR family transcriptional regulator [Dactylosporangium matsuzakiense]